MYVAIPGISFWLLQDYWCYCCHLRFQMPRNHLLTHQQTLDPLLVGMEYRHIVLIGIYDQCHAVPWRGRALWPDGMWEAASQALEARAPQTILPHMWHRLPLPPLPQLQLLNSYFLLPSQWHIECHHQAWCKRQNCYKNIWVKILWQVRMWIIIKTQKSHNIHQYWSWSAQYSMGNNQSLVMIDIPTHNIHCSTSKGQGYMSWLQLVMIHRKFLYKWQNTT